MKTLVLLSALHVGADGLQNIPPWHMRGDEACYDFEGARRLMLLDDEITECHETYTGHVTMIGELKLANVELKKAAGASEQKFALAKQRSDELTAALKKCNLDSANAAAHASTTESAAWVVAGVVTVVGLVAGGTGWFLYYRKK